MYIMLSYQKELLYALNFYIKGFRNPVVIPTYCAAEQEILDHIDPIVLENEKSLYDWCRKRNISVRILR